MKGNRKNRDELKQKEARLAELNERSESAVNLVRATMDGLQSTVEEIDRTIEEVEMLRMRAESAKESLVARKTKNQRIIQNFKALLCED